MRGVLGLMSTLRWTLLILGGVFIAVLAWWERRRPRQASGAVERTAAREPLTDAPPRALREPSLTLPQMHAREPLVRRELAVVELTSEPSPVPVLESAAGGVAAADAAGAHGAAADADAAALPTPSAAPALPRESLPELPPAPPLLVEWPPDQERRILALRLVAPLPERFAGRSLRQALAAEGFVLGQFAIFHKPDEERRAVLSAASLTRPGTFDRDTMDSQHYGGLSLFAVLPGPKSPPQAFDELVFTARNLNERLHGVLQDERGTPLTPARIALLREQLRAGAAS
jgi:ZipA-like protein with FtsZ-binding domain